MDRATPTQTSRPSASGGARGKKRGGTSMVTSWVLFLLKNLVGWIFVIGAFLTGWLPGPGGIPMFLIGFGLVTFPGKRHLTAKLLRGRPVSRRDRDYRIAVAIAAAVVPILAVGYAMLRWPALRPAGGRSALQVVGAYLAAVAVAWFLGLYATPFVNWILRIMGKARRKVRPWLRARGIDLLPPRRRRRFVHGEVVTRDPDHEIIAIHDRLITRMRLWWETAVPWLRRAASLAITVATLAWLLKPVAIEWASVGDRVQHAQHWGVFYAAVLLLAAFGFLRALSWRHTIGAMGALLGAAPAARMWARSELNRYLPGGPWPLVSRVPLARPYGVRGGITVATQVYELVTFTFANALVAIGCAAWLAYVKLRWADGRGVAMLVVAGAFVPVTIAALHPRVFHSTLTRLLAWLKRPPPIDRHLGYAALLRLLARHVLLLGVQGVAAFLIVGPLLGLPVKAWWVVAGAYCLAWCAGSLAFWAPAGLGVRELVFAAAMSFALQYVKGFEQQPPWSMLVAAAVMLRVASVCAELLLAGAGSLIDQERKANGMTSGTLSGAGPRP